MLAEVTARMTEEASTVGRIMNPVCWLYGRDILPCPFLLLHTHNDTHTRTHTQIWCTSSSCLSHPFTACLHLEIASLVLCWSLYVFASHLRGYLSYTHKVPPPPPHYPSRRGDSHFLVPFDKVTMLTYLNVWHTQTLLHKLLFLCSFSFLYPSIMGTVVVQNGLSFELVKELSH